MTRRDAERWMPWVLPLLILRLLLPTGVMPASTAQGAAFVLCSIRLIETAPAPESNHTAPNSNRSQESICPFAAAATPAPVTAVSVPAPQFALLRLAFQAFEAQRTAQSGPLRSQLSRAPPSFS